MRDAIGRVGVIGKSCESLPFLGPHAYRSRHLTPKAWKRRMAGHSQFKNIMHKKGKQDAIRSKLFSKQAREITVAAKMGTPEPNKNPQQRKAVLAARAENMPKDNI